MGPTSLLPFRRKSAGFEPTNLATKGHHFTSRPPKPLATYFAGCFMNLRQRLVVVSSKRLIKPHSCSSCVRYGRVRGPVAFASFMKRVQALGAVMCGDCWPRASGCQRQCCCVWVNKENVAVLFIEQCHITCCGWVMHCCTVNIWLNYQIDIFHVWAREK
jgi:hypothetical protein